LNAALYCFTHASTLRPQRCCSNSRCNHTGYATTILTQGDGGYNLAFDNWINSSAVSKPDNIQFEFMVWEDYNKFYPAGVYQGDVTTSNGTYKFYKTDTVFGAGVYLAFQRTEPRRSGTVDIDQLLNYLIDKKIISKDSYLASLELGNEVGSVKGYSVIKKFLIDIK
jgi:hypothetical protein